MEKLFHEEESDDLRVFDLLVIESVFGYGGEEHVDVSLMEHSVSISLLDLDLLLSLTFFRRDIIILVDFLGLLRLGLITTLLAFLV